ncbi:MAG: hypothetical protein AMS16_02900 [Planctomycetes bacterium DG_58]|nr:MAG: hypothetical protein AMS16_02900 [Planctomycetes bacterium DG_58]
MKDMQTELTRSESRASPSGPRGFVGTRDELVNALLFLRLAAVLVSLAVILVAEAGHGLFQTELFPTYLLLVFVCLVNLGYLVLVRRVRNLRRFAAVQIYLDVLFVGLLIYLNGAGASNITFLYFACILAASSVLGLGPGVTVASLATAMLAGQKVLSFLAEYYGWALPWVRLPAPAVTMGGISSGVAYLMAQAIAYYLVAVLAGRLARGLTGVRLLNEKLLENVTDAVLVVDRLRRVRSMNRQAMGLLGLSPTVQVVGESLDDVLRCSKNPDVLKNLFRKKQGVSSRSVPGTLLTIDGRTAPVAITSSPLSDERGKRLGMVVMFVDLTERRRLEEALARAETASFAEAAAKAEMATVARLAATIAHEIRNPLACIRGSAQEIRSRAEDSPVPADEDTRRLLDIMVKESDRINVIITDFLHFSKMRPAALTRCNLTEVITDVVTMLESRPDWPGSVRFDGGQPVFCTGDVEQLRQVFLNLGLNAIEAMPEGGRLDVRIRQQEVSELSEDTDRMGSRLVVEFTDEGHGMTGEVKAKLFDPFFTTKPRGTGLGLSIVKRIVEAHGGHIEVDTALGRGSTFRVVLQGARAPEASAAKKGSDPFLLEEVSHV